MPNCEVYIVDEYDHRLGPGETGQLIVRGSNVMKGYWGLPAESAEKLRPGPIPGESVLYTGDLFRMDEEGYLYFVGRSDDIIKSRGEKVSPKEIENVIYALDGIQDVAVIGVDDDVLGQAIKVFITLRKGSALDENAILGYCKRNLEDLMVPKFVEIRDHLPKNPSGKIDKRALAG
jgi:acyl-CoA synthetase (AMP-forming)/AMP-acid ligase II